jgi:hypothetical protein
VQDDKPQGVNKQQEQQDNAKTPVPKHLQATAWKPGQSGNSRGRPLGARQRVSEQLIADIADVWAIYGKNVLRRLAAQDPATLAKIAYGLLPKDVFISVEQRTPGNLDPDEWAILRNVIDLIQATTPKGAPLGPVLATIENALRADHATLVNSSELARTDVCTNE